MARATARDRSHRPADARVLLHQVHRVRQALDEGVPEDPELVADLAPPLAVVVLEPELDEHDTDRADERALADTPYDVERDVRTEDTDPMERYADTSAIERRGSSRVPTPVATPPPPVVTDPWESYERPRRSRRGLVLLLVALLLAVGGGVSAWYFGFERYTSTPGVIGLTETQAEARLDRAGLAFKVGDTAYSETVPAGAVISTDPKAGERVLDDGTVSAVISLGLERYAVPRLRGKSEDEAQAAIQDRNLEVGSSVPTYHPTIPEGQVVGTNPKAGTPLKPGAAVDILLSRGPRPIKVVDWTGKDADRAEAALTRQGLEVTRTEDFSDSVAEGKVIQQTPSTGSRFKGDEIELTVSEGPELIEVPGVRGQGIDAATSELEDAGFEVEVRQHQDYLGFGWVLQQSPGSGELARKGSTIVLTVV